MKVFVSWSGGRSMAIAEALREWLPLVLYYVGPWMSAVDISAGERWAAEIGGELETTSFGVICVTPENLNAPWMYFEAGALAKSMKTSRVVPLLYQLELSDIGGPLAQFQAKKLDESGVADVVQSINGAAADAHLTGERIQQLFGPLWPQLRCKLDEIPADESVEKRSRPQRDVLEQLVAVVMGLEARVETLRPVAESEWRTERRSYQPLREWDMHQRDTEYYMLLVIANRARSTLPWVSDALVLAYREMTYGDPREARRVVDELAKRLRRSYRAHTTDGADSDSASLLARDLGFFLRRSGVLDTVPDLSAEASQERETDDDALAT